MANLYDKPNDLDPQPEYPLRTNFTYYTEPNEPLPLPILGVIGGGGDYLQAQSGVAPGELAQESNPSPFPPAPLLFTLWIFGLMVWCMTFANPGGGGVIGGGNKNVATRPRRKKGSSDKEV